MVKTVRLVPCECKKKIRTGNPGMAEKAQRSVDERSKT